MGEIIDRVAETIIGQMFAPHELPLAEELAEKYRATAEAVVKALNDAGYIISPAGMFSVERAPRC